jgi:hypothetical protein
VGTPGEDEGEGSTPVPSSGNVSLPLSVSFLLIACCMVGVAHKLGWRLFYWAVGELGWRLAR